MADNWLEIPDKDINVEDIMRQIQERIARRGDTAPGDEEPLAVAEGLWQEMIGQDTLEALTLNRRVPIRQQDCDIVPRHYVIDWRIPILGPIHAVVRRLINAEIRRYLLPALEKQSRFNRKTRRVLQSLAEENRRLHQALEELRETPE